MIKDSKYYADIVVSFTNLNIDSFVDAATRFVHPIESINKKVEDNLLEGAIKSVDITQVISQQENKVLALVRNATGWIPANPNKEDVSGKVKDTYLPLRGNAGAVGVNIANTLRDDGVFLFENSVKSSPYVLLMGVRGIGKTAFINYWLTLRTKEFEEKNTTWFRIDASKVYKIWIKNKKLNVHDVYVNYFRLHTLFVVFFYGGLLNGPRISIAGVSPLFRSIVERFGDTQQRARASALNIFKQYLVKLRVPKSGDVSNLLVSKIQTSWTLAEQKEIFNAYQVVCDIIEERGIFSIVILDGIDNIAWTQANSFYKYSCRYFSEITEDIVGDFPKGFTFILAARPETKYEINFHCPGWMAGFNVRSPSKFQEWEIHPPIIHEILRTKILAVREKESFKSERSACAGELGDHGNLFNEIINGIELEVKTYPTEIVESIRQSRKQMGGPIKGKHKKVGVRNSVLDDINEKTILKFLFDNDVRGYINNIISVYFIRNRLIKDMVSSKRAFRKRISQYVFLNGRPFFDSREHYLYLEDNRSRANYDDQGSVFPNIFWWNTELSSECPERWHGLAGLRLLQLASITNRFCCGDVLLVLIKLFGYSKRVVIEVLEAFIAFGMIDITHSNETQFVFQEDVKESGLDDYVVTGFLTQKGKVLKEYVFHRLDLIYFYALDTPMHCAIVNDRSQFVRGCRSFSDLQFVEDFYKASIPTVATFLLHMKYYWKKEEMEMKNNNIKYFETYLGGKEVLERELAMPEYIDDILSRYVMDGLNRNRNKIIVDEIKRDVIEGVLLGATEISRINEEEVDGDIGA